MKIEIEDEKHVGIKVELIYTIKTTCKDNKIQKQKQMQNARQHFGIMLKNCWQASIKVMAARDL